ncbi:MAG: hypothetical protein N2645_01885 [Clostridia bacterium]|nr:hypothetical protein [Clostridia bacterium]
MCSKKFYSGKIGSFPVNYKKISVKDNNDDAVLENKYERTGWSDKLTWA